MECQYLFPPDDDSMDNEISCTPSSDFSVSAFTCKSDSFESYLKNGKFDNFLKCSLIFNLDAKNTVVPFRKTYLYPSILYNVHLLFAEIKKNFFIVKSIVVDNVNLLQSKNPISSIIDLRSNICKSLEFCLSTIQSVFSHLTMMSFNNSTGFSSISKMLANVVKETKDLLIFIGRVSCIHTHVRDCGQISECYYHYAHLCLDIWWNSIALFQTIFQSNSIRIDITPIICHDLKHLDPFLQAASVLLCDLVSIAISNYKSCSSSPFLCKCFQDLWIMLIYVLDKKSPIGQDSFWNVYHNTIEKIHKQVSNQKALEQELSLDVFSLMNGNLNQENITEACFWLTSHISPLYKYDVHGRFCDSKIPESGYTTIKYLTTVQLASSCDGMEKSLRFTLFYSLQLLSIWKPSCEILLPLTDFYIKKINETFCLPGEMKSLSYLFPNTFSWFQYITNLSNVCVTLRKETSFDIYLHILSNQLTKDHSVEILWRSLKGRVYSKFSVKKFKELSEVGLQNSFSLLLAIAESGQDEVDKICDLASAVETLCNPRKQTISWRALFVLIHIYQKRDRNFDKIVSKITEFFNSTCNDYSRITRDSMHKTNTMNLLLVYIDSVSEIFEQCQNLKLSECQLIGTGFTVLLSSCSISELNYILQVFLTILMKVISFVDNKNNLENAVIEVQYLGFFEFTFNHIFPFIKNISTTNTPPQLVSDIAAALTSLSYKFATPLVNETSHNFCALFLHFGSKESVNCTVLCRYLCFILDDTDLLVGLKENIPDFCSLIFQSWLRCTIYLQFSSSNLQELSSKIILQNDIVESFPRIKGLNCKSNDSTIEFFRIMGQTFDETSDLQCKNKLRLKVHSYFKKYVTCASNRIMKQCDVPTLSHVYKLSSHLVEHCSCLLHMKFNSDSILPHLLDKIIIPYIVFPKDKSSQSILCCAIKEYLPSFIRGLFKLDYQKDKCIERQIKNIIVNYICIYPSQHNPITKLCLDTINCRLGSLNQEAFKFLLDIIKVNVLLNSAANATNGFELCFEIFKSIPLAKKHEVTNIILKSALDVYMKQGSSLSDYLRNLIRMILFYFKDKVDLPSSKRILIPIFQWFVQEKLQWSSARGFSVLDCLVEYLPQVLTEMIPFLTKTIEELENNRGFGMDITLRSHLRNTVAKLQQKLSSDAQVLKQPNGLKKN